MNKLLLLFSLLGFQTASFCQEPLPQAVPARKPNVVLHVETSRQSSQIQSAYPYDIALKTAQGDTLNSARAFAKNGKPTVLLFWLTTCVPCRHELAAIAGKIEGWQRQADFNFYAVSVDFPKNHEAFARRVGESGWTFPAFLDLNREFRLILPGELNGVPQVFVLDKDGGIVLQKRKYLPGGEDEIFERVRSL